MQDHRDAQHELSDEAIAWIVRLRSGEAGLADHDAFAVWRLRSPDHESAAREAERLWGLLGLAGDAERSGRKRRSRRAVLGAGAGLLVLAGSVYDLRRTGGSGIATAIAERRTLMLEDGSTVDMNAATRMRPSFSGPLRLIHLDAGQATFMVAKDVARPFVVETARGRIQAIGTVFDVNLGSEVDTISVLEGRVRVGGDRSGSFELAAGQGARIGASNAPVAPLDVDAETAWRRGRLRFDARPLGDVVAELGRYRSEPILVLDPRLEALAVTGSFRLDDPESVLSAIEATLPVRVHRLPFVTLIR
ncbi:FecR domain-containing protein [Aureimonas sp. SK2]|uniref:FecR family protein n=1 Tax=Aureimonas sp. SK2 TaxID=3015992 RepID=UPI0024440C90|nr:FecR domain-containing protein [Aureimonas sp. SK2]